MIRKSTVCLDFSNSKKKNILKSILKDFRELTNFYIEDLWDKEIFYGRFVENIEKLDCTFYTERMKQAASRQALRMCKAQRGRKSKIKPVCKKLSMMLDGRFIDIIEDKNSFDLWIKIRSMGKKILYLPAKKHRQFNKFKNWKRKKSVRVYEKDGKFFADIFFEKENKIKKDGETIGLDIGINKLFASSSGETYGKELNNKIQKILRKKHGSKAFKNALLEKSQYINNQIKNIDFSKLYGIIVEDLKNINKNTKKNKKLCKKVRSKQHFWNYSTTINRLEMLAEENNVCFQKVNPAYSSQICSKCKVLDKSSRRGEIFNCKHCGSKMDADVNAAKNILAFGLGEYGPHGLKKKISNYTPIKTNINHWGIERNQ